jgi:hypothetical protein
MLAALRAGSKGPLVSMITASLRSSTLSFIEVDGYGGHSEC